MRRARQLIAAAIAMCAGASSARAQLCHTAPDESDGMSSSDDMDGMDMSKMKMAMPAPPAVTVRADLETDVASINYGEYEGVVPSVAISWWRLDARVATPIYHLEYRGVKSDGPGDLLYSISGTVIDAHRVRAGVSFAATAPTGDEAVGLGMGMSMYMPGAWGSIAHGPWGATASASYGRMSDLGAPGGHHHAVMVGALVNPMNMEEVAGSLRGTYRATRSLRLHVLGSVATPIELAGTTRAFAAAGAHVRSGAWEVGFEAALPLAGDPFHARMALDLARTF